jgi:hypothetical protein
MTEEKFKRFNSIEDPVKRRVFFVGLLTREIVSRGGNPPIIVGGEAVEIYTQGSYSTGDIDIKAPKSLTEKILSEWGFLKKGRVWFNASLDIYIDWLGESLDEGPEAERRVNTVQIGDGLEVKVISIEDLIIDRVNASKWWKDSDSLMWAKVLMEVKKALGEKLDKEYILRRAKKEQIMDIIEEILREEY